MTTQMEYIFLLKYRLAEVDCDHDELVERLATSGCNDALVGVSRPGRLALEFARESADATTAVMSALADVKRAIPTAELIEVSAQFPT